MFNIVLISLGAIILFFALFLFLAFRKEEKVEFGILSKKITLINNIFHLLILFFFIGYCLIFSQIYHNAQSGNLIMILAQVLFWGAVFVVITIVLLKIMLETIVATKLNQTDSLTSLLNKMAGHGKIDEALITGDKPVFLAILDLDNFKKANDIYGHLVGDEILIKIAQIIKTNVEKTDISCRFGGDEFVIALFDKNEEQAKSILEQIQKSVTEVAASYKEANLSISIGVAYGVGKGAGGSSTCVSMMQNADKALYHVKKNGKNAVHLFSEANNIYS